LKKATRNRILCLFLILLSFTNQGCNKNSVVDNFISSIAEKVSSLKQEQGSYPSALYWNEALYQPTADKPIDKSSIGVEIGEIIEQVVPIPKRNGEINDTRNFSIGDRLFSINQIEETEAIAVQKNGTYYRLDRIRSSLGVIWDGKVYDFVGNFDQEDEVNNIDIQLGLIKVSGINPEGATDGDITASGVEANSSYFPVGSKIYSLKNISLNCAIAVSDKNGKYHKALYVKRK